MKSGTAFQHQQPSAGHPHFLPSRDLLPSCKWAARLSAGFSCRQNHTDQHKSSEGREGRKRASEILKGAVPMFCSEDCAYSPASGAKGKILNDQKLATASGKSSTSVLFSEAFRLVFLFVVNKEMNKIVSHHRRIQLPWVLLPFPSDLQPGPGAL
jgi:hypothetical protein